LRFIACSRWRHPTSSRAPLGQATLASLLVLLRLKSLTIPTVCCHDLSECRAPTVTRLHVHVRPERVLVADIKVSLGCHLSRDLVESHVLPRHAVADDTQAPDVVGVELTVRSDCREPGRAPMERAPWSQETRLESLSLCCQRVLGVHP